MESLPNELLNHIFGFLHPIYDNLARLSLVCKRWKAVIEETPSLWKCIHFTRAYPFFITKNAKHREVLRHCLLKFGRYVTCLRDHPITRTFAEPSLRDILPNLSNLTCLDVPLLEWEPRFLQSLTCASTLEELNLTEYLLSEPPKIQWLFQQPDSLKKNFLTPQHLQMILLRFPRLKILKLALDCIAVPPPTLTAFLNKTNITELELSGFGLTPSLSNHFILNRDMCLRTIASSQRLASLITRLELRTCPLFYSSDDLQSMLKLMKSLRHLFVGAGLIHRDPKSLLSIESSTLITLGIDGLPTLRMQCLRCNTPNLREFELANCRDMTAVFVYSTNLESMCLRDLYSVYNLQTTSIRLNHLELWTCPEMPVTALRNFLKEHQTIQKLSLIGGLTGLTLYGCMCPHLSELKIMLFEVQWFKLGSIKIDCPSLKRLYCDGNWRNPFTRTPDDFSGFPRGLSTCSIFIRSGKLQYVWINLPNASTISVKCKQLDNMNVTIGEEASCLKESMEFEVIADKIICLHTTNCKFSRYHLQATDIGAVTLRQCEIYSDGSIPLLIVHTKSIIKLTLDNCHNMEFAELRVKPKKAARHVYIYDCDRLRSIAITRTGKSLPKISIVNCKNLQGVASGRQDDFSNVFITDCPLFNIPKLQQNRKNNCFTFAKKMTPLTS